MTAGNESLSTINVGRVFCLLMEIYSIQQRCDCLLHLFHQQLNGVLVAVAGGPAVEDPPVVCDLAAAGATH